MTEKQYSFAWNIANTLGISLPENYSNKAFAIFIDKNLPNFKIKQEEQRQKYQDNYKLAQLQDVIESEVLYKQESNL